MNNYYYWNIVRGFEEQVQSLFTVAGGKAYQHANLLWHIDGQQWDLPQNIIPLCSIKCTTS